LKIKPKNPNFDEFQTVTKHSPMPLKTCIFCSLFACLSLQVFSQKSSSIELRGAVIEVSEGDSKGVAGVTVSVAGQDYDITDEQGNFSMFIQPTEDFIILTLENCPYPMIDPRSGQISMPPPGNLQVRVCALENDKLRAKIDGLNNRIGKLERERQLSKRQLEYMHRTLLDTILFYEKQVQNLNETLDEKNAELAEKQHQIASLERKVALLEQQLFEALEEKYLRQQQTLKSVAGDLNAYRSRLKDVQHELPRLSNCFLHPDGCENFYSAIRKYSEARNKIDETHSANVESVGHYWDSRALSGQLEETYSYILKTIHEPIMFGMLNEQVLDPLKEYSTKKKGRIAAQKETERGAGAVQQSLAPMVIELDKKIDEILKLLTKTI
jgi:DNA repair exonuclease SbcCD ATPase subunit